jgi:hypothetical protein
MDPFDTKSFELSSLETETYDKLFKICDTQQSGIISAQQAVPFLSKSRLNQDMLSKVVDSNQDMAALGC